MGNEGTTGSNHVHAAPPGTLRRRLAARQVTHGGWCMLSDAFAAEIVSASGVDWLCVDMQHGYAGDEAVRHMVQAAAIRATPVLVRVPWNEPSVIMRALDAGADGVIVPMINSASDARAAVAASRYPPLGTRSWGPLRASLAQPGFSPSVGNELTVCVAMVETVEAVANLEEIVSVPGLDGILIGPNDLAISHRGSNDGAATSSHDVELIRHVARLCERVGLCCGIVCASGADAKRWQAASFTLLALSSDVALLADGMSAQLSAARA